MGFSDWSASKKGTTKEKSMDKTAAKADLSAFEKAKDQLREFASDGILQQCAALDEKPAALEAYLNQCVKQKQITAEAASTLLSCSKRYRELARKSVSSTILHCCNIVKDSPEKLKAYLRECVSQKLISEAQGKAILAYYQNLPYVSSLGTPVSKAKPKPVAVEPEPVMADPEPVMEEPEPVVMESEPMAEEPEPVPVEPEPIMEVWEPELVIALPERIAVEPEPVAVEAETVFEEEPLLIDAPESVITELVVPPQNTLVQEKQQVFCHDCGRQVSPYDKFCCFCGITFRTVNETEFPRWYCRSCNTQILVGSKFCRSCGASAASPIIQQGLTMSCPSCGQELSANARFCRHCGIAIGSASTAQTLAPSNTCRSCGKALGENAKFCSYCGTAVEGKPVPSFPRGHCQSCGEKLGKKAKFCRHCGTPVKS